MRRQIRLGRPARAWTDALPIGNGYSGAMLYAGVGEEHLQINEGSAWSGSPNSELVEPRLSAVDAANAVRAAREAIKAERFDLADAALRRLQHRHSQTFLPFVDLFITLETPTSSSGYERVLDLATATHDSSFTLGQDRVTKRTYASHPDRVIVHEVHAESGTLPALTYSMTTPLHVQSVSSEECSIRLLVELPSDVAPSHDEADRPIRYTSKPGHSLQGAAVLHLVHDGQATVLGTSLRVERATEVVAVISTETTFAGIACPPVGSAAEVATRVAHRVARAASDLGAVRDRHLADVTKLLGRVQLELGHHHTEPTDALVRAARTSECGVVAANPDLLGLLFDYGRYLLVSCSREGGVPANLQGIWNNALQPPWSSNYTVNINLQMNYWLAETTALPECLPPLFELIEGLSRTGKRTARELYAAPGWVAHHNTDIWAYTLPVGGGAHDPKWAFWPFAGVWLVRHLWDRVAFGADHEFAAARAWPAIRGATEFLLAWLQEQPDGTLGTCPSTSPENQFETPDGQVWSAAESSASDLEMTADLFRIATSIGTVLGGQDDLLNRVAAAQRRLAQPSVGAEGTVQEWRQPFILPEPNHRHLSSLYRIHPADGPLDADFAAAARSTLDHRGDEGTGWSLAWKMLMRARLHQPDAVARLLELFFRDASVSSGQCTGGMYLNLFSAHPPFQIDGNLGLVAAIAECLVQSHAGRIELLPSVPPTLGPGSIAGIMARPGVSVTVRWSINDDGEAVLEHATLTPQSARAFGPHVVQLGERTVNVDLSIGPVDLDQTSFG